MTGPTTYKYVPPKTGVGSYVPHEDMGQVSEYRLQLDWIPVSLKNRSRTMWMKGKVDDGEIAAAIAFIRGTPSLIAEALSRLWKLAASAGSILHFRDKKVDEDIQAIRLLWSRVSPRPPVCPLRMELEVTIFRPMSKAEIATAHWNQRRGDLVSAHELICDALEGCFYENDSQVTRLVLEERRDCAVPSVMIVGRPRA